MEYKNFITAAVKLVAILSAVGVSTACATPLCRSAASDSDGDGFGWEDNASCRVSVNSATSTPVCTSANSDPDGDGFGWESNASCRVTSTTPAQSGSNNRPVCSSSAADPDGDGFGWENQTTCVVQNNQSSTAANTPLAEETVRLSVPGCSAPRFDPDGDGFGWENSHSCTLKNAGDGGASITDVILVTGQSNALGGLTGQLDPDVFDPALDASVKRVYAYSNNGWGIAGLMQIWDAGWYPRADIGGVPSNNFAFHFGKSLVKLDADAVVGIIMVTAPGKAIEHWDKDGDFFSQIDSKVKSALGSLPGNPKVHGILWHQGESDYVSNNYYSERLQQLIGNFRARNWYASDGLFICGETLNAPVNDRLMRLNQDGDARTGCVSSEGLVSVGDDVHFNAESLRTLGSRYASKYRSMSR